MTELQRRYGSLTPEQVAALDRAAADIGVEVAQLMELAGMLVARSVWEMLGEQPRAVSVFAGHGNNGGDGLVVARFLATWGCAVHVHLLAAEERLGDLLRRHLQAARLCGAQVTFHNTEDDITVLEPTALCVDAVLGTGLRSEPRAPHTAAIRAMNLGQAPVLSVDVPSGLDAVTGKAFQHCVRATRTVTLGAMKAGLWAEGAAPYAGQLVVADIAIPAAAWERCRLTRPTEVAGGGLLPVPSATR